MSPSPALPDPASRRRHRRLLAALFFAGVATFAQLYSTQAVLPQIAAEFDVGSPAAAMTVSAATIGVAITVLVWAWLSDRLGRRPTMLISMSIATALGLGGLLTAGLEPLIAMRLAEGLALGGVPAIAIAYLSEEVDADRRAPAAATYVSGTAIGGLTGRVLAGAITDGTGDWRLGVLGVLLMCVAAVVLFLSLAPAPRGFVPAAARADGGFGARVAASLRDPRLLALYLQAFVLMGTFASTFNYLSFHLAAAPYELGALAVSLLFLTYLSGSVASDLAGRLARRVPMLAVLVGAEAIMVLGLGTLVVPSVPVKLVGLLLMVCGFFGAHAVATGWTAIIAGPVSAQAGSFYTLGYYLGAGAIGWAGGYIFDHAGWTALVAGEAVALVVAAAVAVGVLSQRGRRRRPAV